jgi:hypothetical protein
MQRWKLRWADYAIRMEQDDIYKIPVQKLLEKQELEVSEGNIKMYCSSVFSFSI